ncbi:hypothetical protein GLYMA_10G290350v4 [Glycine max]|nr:hypothetical protein GLYMA_10G290350v4 [Glycine max]KAH1140612.1 hypothetical protein GYH30_029481 [Glycine max]
MGVKLLTNLLSFSFLFSSVCMHTIQVMTFESIHLPDSLRPLPSKILFSVCRNCDGVMWH